MTLSEKNIVDETHCVAYVHLGANQLSCRALPWSQPIRLEDVVVCGNQITGDSGQKGVDSDNVMHTRSRAEQTTQWNNTQ